MAGFTQNVNTFTDYGAEAQDIERRRKMAEMLQQQALQPIEQTTAGGYVTPISWTQGLAKALQGYAGMKGQEAATQQSKDLASRRNQAMAETLGAMPQSTSTDLNPVSKDDEGNIMPPSIKTTAPAPQDYAAWLGRLGSIGPDAMQIGSTLAQHQMKQNDPFTLAEGAQLRGRNGEIIAENPKDFRPQPTAPMFKEIGIGNDMVQEHVSLDGGKTWQKVQGSQPTHKFARNPDTIVNNPPPATPVTVQDPNEPNSTIVIDARTRQVLGKGPKFSDAGKLEKNREFSMSGIGATIQQAEDLLKGVGGGALPTNSSVGNILDVAGGAFGISPSGAKEADQLKVLGGALVSKVPRMQGPQSDKDVMLYKQMAGQVGDATLPRERRLAALEKVKELYSKYEGQQTQPAGATGGWSIKPVR